MKKVAALIISIAMMSGAFVTGQAEAAQLSGAPLVGIAWRADTDSEFFTNICKAVEAAGADWVMLDQVRSADLNYDSEGRLTEGVTALGSLDETAAKYVRMNNVARFQCRGCLERCQHRAVYRRGGHQPHPVL